MKDQTRGFSFAFKRPFHFESNGSLDHVLRSLQQLEDDFPPNRMSIQPDGESGQTFRYQVERRSKGRTRTTAWSEGRIWQADGGRVIVRGHTQIEPLGAYIMVGIYLIFACACLPLMNGIYVLLPLVFTGLAAFHFFQIYMDYHQAFDHISEAVYNTHNIPENVRREMNEPLPVVDRGQQVRTPVRETVKPDSIWNEAISEYERSASQSS